MKTDDATLNGQAVQITSSIEAAKLNCTAGLGGFSVSKRIGIGNKARIDSVGRIKIGSVFSNMRELPEVGDLKQAVVDLTLERFLSDIAESLEHKEQGLLMTAEDDIMIDNMQGVVTLHTSKASNIALHTVESAKMVINAPNAHVSLNLKSIHDLSMIHCTSAELLIGEGFDACDIYDVSKGKLFDRASNSYVDELPSGDRPLLKILAADKLTVRVMSDFEILRR